MGKYQYKVVLVCAGSAWFRNSNLEYASLKLKAVDLKSTLKEWQYGIRTQSDLDYAFGVLNKLMHMKDYTIRVESVWLSFYSNSLKDINDLINIDKTKVKYMCQPAGYGKLEQNTVVMPKIPYDFKVTLSKTTTNYQHFIEWSENNPKFKLTKTCIRDLSKNRSWGGSYFYVTGDKNLLMAKMHLGGCISKIERIVRS